MIAIAFLELLRYAFLKHYAMTEKSKQRKHLSQSQLENLRIERTNLSQDELAIKCGIPRSTYQRWISGKTIARPTIPQLKMLCEELRIERIEEIPDNFGVIHSNSNE